MGGRLIILWGVGEGYCPGVASKSTLPWYPRVSGEPDVDGQVGLAILRGCNWTGELLANFTRPFGGSLVGESICIGGS